MSGDEAVMRSRLFRIEHISDSFFSGSQLILQESMASREDKRAGPAEVSREERFSAGELYAVGKCFRGFRSCGIVNEMRARDTRMVPKGKKQARSRPLRERRAQKILLPPRKHLTAAGENRPVAVDRTRLVLLTVDPYVIHAYWTLSSRAATTARLQLGNDSERSEAVLRFYDTMCLPSGSPGISNSFDIPVELNAHNWYVHLWASAKSYWASLGLRTEDGRFFPIARSNLAQTPRAGISNGGKESFMLVKGNYDHIEQIQNTAGPYGKEEPVLDTTRDPGRPLFTDPSATLRVGSPSVDIAAISERAFICGAFSLLGVPGSGRIDK